MGSKLVNVFRRFPGKTQAGHNQEPDWGNRVIILGGPPADQELLQTPVEELQKIKGVQYRSLKRLFGKKSKWKQTAQDVMNLLKGQPPAPDPDDPEYTQRVAVLATWLVDQEASGGRSIAAPATQGMALDVIRRDVIPKKLIPRIYLPWRRGERLDELAVGVVAVTLDPGDPCDVREVHIPGVGNPDGAADSPAVGAIQFRVVRLAGALPLDGVEDGPLQRRLVSLEQGVVRFPAAVFFPPGDVLRSLPLRVGGVGGDDRVPQVHAVQQLPDLGRLGGVVRDPDLGDNRLLLVQHRGEQLHLPVQHAPEPFPVHRDRGQRTVQASGVHQAAEPAADQVVQQVSSMIADLAEVPRPGQRARDGHCQDEHQQVAPSPPPARVRDKREHLQQARDLPVIFFIGAGHGGIGGMRN